MSASFSVPAACIARSAAIITAMPPLSSPEPGPIAVIAAPFPALERAVGLEHRVEMADQQQPLAAAIALVRRDDVARAARLRACRSTGP